MATPAISAKPESEEYLTRVCQLLWPPPASAALISRRSARGADPAGRTPRGPGDSEFIVLPGAVRPKLIVPGGRKAAAAAVRRYGEPGSAKTMLATRTLAIMLAAGLRSALGDRLIVRVPGGAQTIGSYLAELAGQPVEIGLHVGAARANRKPVLQLLNRAGDTIGFAKIGISELTADLVNGEHAALNGLGQARLTKLRPPAVLGRGSWNGLEVLLLDALPVWLRRRRLTDDRLAAALAELARSAGLTQSTLSASGYTERLLGRLGDGSGAEALGAGGSGAEALGALISRLADVAGDSSLTFGCWHGDLTPWNLAYTSAGLLVWDWERYAVGVPVGFDALHYWLQARVVRQRRDPADAAAGCVAIAPRLLAPFGVPPAQARLTALAYLAELSVRYLADRQAEAGARLGAPERWLTPAIEAGIGQL
jgi:hypothetical protein